MNELLNKAIKIALEAHQGQVDKAGELYVLHPLRLMIQAKTSEEKIVAVLHDVVEDADFTFAYLAQQGFPTTIIEALKCLTKQHNETYNQFIQRILPNPLARKIKILDIRDNIRVERLKKISSKDCERLNKYLEALQILEQSP